MELTAKGLELFFHIRHFTTFYKIMQHCVLYALSASVVLLEYIRECKKTRIFYMETYVEIPLKRQRSYFVCLCTSDTYSSILYMNNCWCHGKSTRLGITQFRFFSCMTWAYFLTAK